MGHWAWRAFRLPLHEILTAVHVLAWLTLVEFGIRIVALPALCRRLGFRFEPGGSVPVSASARPALPQEAQQRLRSLWRVSARWPFSKGPCLRRSLVGGRLLRRHDPVLRLGVMRQGDAVVAHAWLEVGGHALEDVESVHPFERSGRRAP